MSLNKAYTCGYSSAVDEILEKTADRNKILEFLSRLREPADQAITKVKDTTRRGVDAVKAQFEKIPPSVRSEAASALHGGALGSLVGGDIGQTIGILSKTKAFNDYYKRMQADPSRLVDVQEFMQKYAPSGKAMDAAEFKKALLSKAQEGNFFTRPFRKLFAHIEGNMAERETGAGNAFFHPEHGYVHGAGKVDPSVAAHEVIGHGGQMEEMGRDAFEKFLRRKYAGPFSVLGGSKYRIERDAWDRVRKSGFPLDPEAERVALDTYKGQMQGKRFGALLGGIGGAVAGSPTAQKFIKEKGGDATAALIRKIRKKQ